ncbi:MAG TPA: TMEM175 family protein [Lichenihabitans sp.]|jgi:uncharacterized membrane protein|nr:TMEM175 family protein [Lichenihabitans sp.]
MRPERLTALTDGVIAVIITIMVLEMKAPHDTDLAALAAVWPVFLSYVLSFIYVAIYWNNHHHFFHLVKRVNGAVLWANLHLLFWLSLIPFTTAWMGEHAFAAVPTAAYGVSLLTCALGWYLMQSVIVRSQGADSALRQAIGRDLKGKASPLLYVAGIGLAFVVPVVSDLIYAGVALLWLVPDRRVEARLAAPEGSDDTPPGVASADGAS